MAFGGDWLEYLLPVHAHFVEKMLFLKALGGLSQTPHKKQCVCCSCSEMVATGQEKAKKLLTISRARLTKSSSFEC